MNIREEIEKILLQDIPGSVGVKEFSPPRACYKIQAKTVDEWLDQILSHLLSQIEQIPLLNDGEIKEILRARKDEILSRPDAWASYRFIARAQKQVILSKLQ